MAMTLVVIDDEPAARDGLRAGLGQYLGAGQLVIEQDLASVPDEVLAAAPVIILGYHFLSNVVELRQRNLFKPSRVIVYGREQQARMAGLHRLAFVPRQIGMDRLWRTVKMIDRGIVPVSAVTSFVEHPDLPDLTQTSTVHLIKGRIDPAGLDRATLIVRLFVQDNLTTKQLVRALAKTDHGGPEIDDVEIDAVLEAACSVFLVKDRRELRQQLIWMLANAEAFNGIVEPLLALCARARRQPAHQML